MAYYAEKIFYGLIGFFENGYYLTGSISEKPNPMNSISKKRTSLRSITNVRTIGLSLLFFAFIAVTLYVLINSPA